ncbi:MAG: metal-dependent phosphohydrolase [Ilumatobacteraceae bacterium]
MTAPEVELRRAWRAVVGPAGAARPSPATEATFESLLARHREPHRRYHTATHVMWVLRHLHELSLAGEGPSDVPAVQLAALFHDMVYDPRTTDNEARSAARAAEAATQLGWSPERCAMVHRLVMATAGHEPTDADEAALVDADLAILGAPPNEYAAYARAVRAEYAHVSDDAWRVGRAAVLRGFAARSHLYATAHMRSTRESRAFANVAAELATLSA